MLPKGLTWPFEGIWVTSYRVGYPEDIEIIGSCGKFFSCGSENRPSEPRLDNTGKIQQPL